MTEKRHNDPEAPPQAFLDFMRENYILVSDDLIYSLKVGRYIGTRSNGCAVHDGYARVKVNIREGEKFFKYHHVTFFLYYGRWPRKQLDHPNDKNNHMPELLEEVTDAENQKRRNQHLKNRRAAYYQYKNEEKYLGFPEEKAG